MTWWWCWLTARVCRSLLYSKNLLGPILPNNRVDRLCFAIEHSLSLLTTLDYSFIYQWRGNYQKITAICSPGLFRIFIWQVIERCWIPALDQGNKWIQLKLIDIQRYFSPIRGWHKMKRAWRWPRMTTGSAFNSKLKSNQPKRCRGLSKNHTQFVLFRL